MMCASATECQLPYKTVKSACCNMLTIVISAHDHPSTILYKFVMLVTIVPIWVGVGVFAIAFAIVISSERLNSNFVSPVTQNEMIAPTTRYPAMVFGQLNAHKGFVTQMCVMEADNVEHRTDEMIAPTTAHPVFGQLNSQEGFATQMCVMEADNA
ncbi:hypothetical protein Tco_0875227 [Tanacetum coccineum]|uniref:Uncharacterized protein n=1 Tax=Tanacetum coccineum TaxID=301880 RepID=A0ABQ5BNU9_9ASTR